MKKELRGFALGVITTAVVFGASAAYAGGFTQTIEVVFNNVTLKVNGQKAYGENILYNGTTYVGIREVANMLGKDIGWDEYTKTASINDKVAQTVENTDTKELDDRIDTNSVFADINIESIVRKELKKLTGELTKEDLESLKTLRINSVGAKSIAGLEKLINLEELDLSGNSLKDITLLSNLKNLKRLGLFGNQITDLKPLKNLANLEELNIRYNGELKDLTPLENLTNLKQLYITDTQVSDISPLVKLLHNGGLKSGINYYEKSHIMLHNNRLNLKSTATLNNLQELLDKDVIVEYLPQQQQ